MSLLFADDFTKVEHNTLQSLVKRWLLLMLHYTKKAIMLFGVPQPQHFTEKLPAVTNTIYWDLFAD